MCCITRINNNYSSDKKLKKQVALFKVWLCYTIWIIEILYVIWGNKYSTTWYDEQIRLWSICVVLWTDKSLNHSEESRFLCSFKAILRIADPLPKIRLLFRRKSKLTIKVPNRSDFLLLLKEEILRAWKETNDVFFLINPVSSFKGYASGVTKLSQIKGKQNKRNVYRSILDDEISSQQNITR